MSHQLRKQNSLLTKKLTQRDEEVKLLKHERVTLQDFAQKLVNSVTLVEDNLCTCNTFRAGDLSKWLLDHPAPDGIRIITP